MNIEKSKKSNEEEYLEILLAYSERAIDNRSGNIDDLFREQIKRLQKRLEEIKNEKKEP